MRLEDITQKDLDECKLDSKTKAIILAKAIPLVFFTYLLSFWEYLIVLFKIPGDVVDMITLEEVLIKLTEKK